MLLEYFMLIQNVGMRIETTLEHVGNVELTLTCEPTVCSLQAVVALALLLRWMS